MNASSYIVFLGGWGGVGVGALLALFLGQFWQKQTLLLSANIDETKIIGGKNMRQNTDLRFWTWIVGV